MATVAQLIIELRASTDKLVTDLNKNMSHIRRFQNDLGRFGSTMTQNVTLPIIGMGLAATKFAADFELSFADVKKTFDTTGLSAEQAAAGLKEMEEGIKELAKKLPATTKELTKVASIAQQMGIKGSKNVLEFTKTVVDFANSTNISMDEAGFAISRFAAVSGLADTELRNVASTIVKLGNTSKTNEARIVRFAEEMAAAGKNAKLSAGLILGLAATASAAGIEAEAGASSFSKLFASLTKSAILPGESKKLELFARTVDRTSESFKNLIINNPDQAVEEFLVALGKLSESKSAIPVIEALGLADIRLSRTILSTSSTYKDLSKNIANARREMSISNDAERAITIEANQRYATFTKQLEVLRNRGQLAAIAFGNLLLPAIIKVTEVFIQLAEAASKLPEPMRNTVIVVGAFLALIGPLAFAIRGIVGGFTLLSEGILLFSKAGRAGSQGFQILAQGGAVLKNFGLVVFGLARGLLLAHPVIATAVLAIVGSLYLLQDETSSGSLLVKSIIKFPLAVAKYLIDGFKQIAKSVAQGIIDFFDILTSETNSSIATFFKDFGAVFMKGAELLYPSFVAFLRNFDAKFVDPLVDKLEFILDVAKLFLEDMGTMFSKGIENIGDFWGVDELVELGQVLKEASKGELGLVARIKERGAAQKEGAKNTKKDTEEKDKNVTATDGLSGSLKKLYKELTTGGGAGGATDKATKAIKKLRDEIAQTNLDIQETKVREAINSAVAAIDEAALEPLLKQLAEIHKKARLQGLKDSAEEGGAIAQKLAEQQAEIETEEAIRTERNRIGPEIQKNRERIHKENSDFLRGQLEDVISGTRFNWEEQGKKAGAYIASEFLAAMLEANFGAAFNLQELFSGVLQAVAKQVSQIFLGKSLSGGLLGSIGSSLGLTGSGGILSSISNQLGIGSSLASLSAAGAGISLSGVAGGAEVAAATGGNAFGTGTAIEIAGGGAQASPLAALGNLAAVAYAAYETIDELKDVGKSREETAEGLTTAAGTALGAYFGGPIGAAIGAKIGEVAGKFLGDAISNNGDIQAQERKLLENSIEDLLAKAADEGNPLQIYGQDGSLQDFGDNLVFGDNGKFAELDEAGRGWAERFWTDFGDKGAGAFQAVGVGLANFLGIAQEQGDKLGLILAENFATGSDLYTSLDNIKLFLDNIGISTEQLTASLFEMAKAGEISWLQFEQFRQQLALIPEEGLAASGAYVKAMDLFLESQGRGVKALNALKYLAIEASEGGVTSLEGLRLKLIEAGYSVEDVDALFAAFAQRNIKSLDDLKNASEETLGGIVADAELLGVTWEKQAESMEEAAEGTEQVEFKVRKLDESIGELSSSIENIPSKTYTITEVRKVEYQDSGPPSSSPPPSPPPTDNSGGGRVFRSGNGISKFASGGVFHTPQTFNYGTGKLGMLGEAGPEAILPLKRTSGGRLGVSAEGLGQGGTTIINIDASGAAPGVEEKIAATMNYVINAAANQALQSISKGRGR